MKKNITALFSILLTLSLTACANPNISSMDASDASELEKKTSGLLEKNKSELQNALQNALAEADSTEPTEYNLAPSAFMTAEGEPSYEFHGQETMDFTVRLSSDRKYFLDIDVWGDENEDIQVQVTSKPLGLSKETLTPTPDPESGFWKLLDLTAGEYTFTAKNINDNHCLLVATIRPIEELPELTDTLTLEHDMPGTYLCTSPEDTSLHYTFRDERTNPDTFGPAAAFYHADSHKLLKTIYLEKGETEAQGSIDFPAGDIILYVNINGWSIISFE